MQAISSNIGSRLYSKPPTTLNQGFPSLTLRGGDTMIFLGVEMFEVAGLKVICCSSDDDMTRYAVVVEGRFQRVK